MTEHDLAVRDLLAKQAITEVIHTYCRALDRMDRDLALSVWHPGGTADYPPMFTGTGEGFVDWVWKAHEALTAHSHQITNILIRVGEDGATAVSESYVTVVLRGPGGDESTVAEITARGRYADRWSLRDGRWAVDARRHTLDFQTVQMLPRAAADLVPPEHAGRRDTEDPSYAVLGR
ncbi:nuclear transport factor 2 family protein [Yinghuangia sp. YIM S09857]|uniref:nuclear transport factor 2 family protein n=1 Tax=Yinghuangia sp. YIM S09857 TaxID=3436929 RepID=UPI003F52BC07